MKDTGYKDLEELRQGSTTAYCISLNSDNNDKGNFAYIIWLRKFEAGCLVHELTHLTMFIFDEKGIPIRQENTEAFSYYTEYWFNEIMRVKRRLPNGRKAADAKK